MAPYSFDEHRNLYRDYLRWCEETTRLEEEFCRLGDPLPPALSRAIGVRRSEPEATISP